MSAADLAAALARRLPPPPVSAVPFPLQRLALERALALAFREPLARGELAFLEGRRLRVAVTDLGLAWDITHVRAALRVLPPGPAPDVDLRSDLRGFALLATRRADPDTLFFRRRLAIAGDTELGLACKNLMDALEPEDWHPLAPVVLAAVGRWLDPPQGVRRR
ncbi:putative lipid carrier protein [Salinisphaera sp. PC39]|uniref:ubiquinone anaerobic biosynthesis accessory factor UbiT n=1 Tax=Salinisphaera sp. PC39 TaxID=1304156 RepID=UPI00333E31B6